MKLLTFIWPPHSHATQGIHFIDTLDQHRPRLAIARRGGLLTRWLVGYGGLRLVPHPTRLVRVPTVITNQVRALGPGTRAERWSVLCAQFVGAPFTQGSETLGWRTQPLRGWLRLCCFGSWESEFPLLRVSLLKSFPPFKPARRGELPWHHRWSWRS